MSKFRIVESNAGYFQVQRDDGDCWTPLRYYSGRHSSREWYSLEKAYELKGRLCALVYNNSIKRVVE